MLAHLLEVSLRDSLTCNENEDKQPRGVGFIRCERMYISNA